MLSRTVHVASNLEEGSEQVASFFEKFLSSVKHIQIIAKVVGRVSQELPLIGSGVELLCEVREAHQDYGFNQQAFQTLQQKLNHANWVYCKASALHFGRMITDSSDSIEEEVNQLGKAIEETIRDLLPKLAHLRQANTYVGAFASALQGMSEVSYDEKLIAQISDRIAVTVEAIEGRCGDELSADHKLKLQELLNRPKDMDFRTSRRYPALNKQKSWLSVHVKSWLEGPSKPVMWLEGQGGMGKSHFCSSLAKELYVDGQLVACLGFRFSDPSKNHPMALIKSLLCYTLCSVINPEDPGVVAYFFECLIKKHELLAVLDSRTYDQEELGKALVLVCDGLKAILENLSKDDNSSLSTRKPMLLIVDAVNEVDPSYRNLLEPFLSEIAGYLECLPNIKMLVTSTNSAEDFNLGDLCDCRSFNDQRSKDDNKQDVKLFLQDCWKNSNLPSSMKDELIDYIYKSSEGKFIVLKLMEKALKELPSLLNENKVRTGEDLQSWLFAKLDFSKERPYEYYIAQIAEKHYPMLAIMISIRIPLSLTQIATLTGKSAELIQFERHEFDRLFIFNDEEENSERESLNAGLFQVYHESVFISFDNLKHSGRAAVSLFPSTQRFIQEIINAEIKIAQCFDDLYDSLVEHNGSIVVDSELQTLFSSEYINTFLRQQDVRRIQRCLTLKWIEFRLSKDGDSPSQKFSIITHEYDQVALFILTADLSFPFEVMSELLKASMSEINNLNEGGIRFVCTQICGRLLSVEEDILRNIYIKKLKLEAENYLRENGGWILTNPILPQVKLRSMKEKLVLTKPDRQTIGIYEFGSSEDRHLVSFKRDGWGNILIEVFGLFSWRKIFEWPINVFQFCGITQLYENEFIIWCERDNKILRLEINTLAKNGQVSVFDQMPTDEESITAIRRRSDENVWFVWVRKEDAKMLVWRKDLEKETKQVIPFPFKFTNMDHATIATNILLNERVFILINHREVFELVNFCRLEHIYTCEYLCSYSVILPHGLFLYGENGSHLFNFDSKSVHTQVHFLPDLSKSNRLFSGSSNKIYLSTSAGFLVLLNIEAVQELSTRTMFQLKVKNNVRRSHYCFMNGSDRYCLRFIGKELVYLYDIKSLVLIKTFQTRFNPFNIDYFGKEMLVCENSVFLMNFNKPDSSRFVLLSGDYKDYCLLKIWFEENDSIYSLGFKDSKFYHLTVSEEENGRRIVEIPHSNHHLGSKKLKEVYELKDTSKSCDNYYEGIDEEGISHLLECIPREDHEGVRIGYEMRCCYSHDKEGERFLNLSLENGNLLLLYTPCSGEYTNTINQIILERGSNRGQFNNRAKHQYVSRLSASWKFGTSSEIPILEKENSSRNLIEQFDGMNFTNCMKPSVMKEIYLVKSLYEGIDEEGRSHLLSKENVEGGGYEMRCCYCCETKGERILDYDKFEEMIVYTSKFGSVGRYYKFAKLRTTDPDIFVVPSEFPKIRRRPFREKQIELFQYNDFVCQKSFIFHNIDQMLLAENLIGVKCNFHFPIDILDETITMNHFLLLSHHRYDKGVEVEVIMNSLICVKIFYTHEEIEKIGRPTEEEIQVIQISDEGKESEVQIKIDSRDPTHANPTAEDDKEHEKEEVEQKERKKKDGSDKGKGKGNLIEGLVKKLLKWIKRNLLSFLKIVLSSPIIVFAIIFVILAIIFGLKRK